VLLRPGDRATVTSLGWLDIDLPARNRSSNSNEDA